MSDNTNDTYVAEDADGTPTLWLAGGRSPLPLLSREGLRVAMDRAYFSGSPTSEHIDRLWDAIAATAGEAPKGDDEDMADAAHLPNYGFAASNALTDLLTAEPTPEQVEAETVCNCDYVARGGPGATPERPVEHHPLCDINLPADKQSGPRAEQVEADLAQDEQAHAAFYATRNEEPTS